MKLRNRENCRGSRYYIATRVESARKLADHITYTTFGDFSPDTRPTFEIVQFLPKNQCGLPEEVVRWANDAQQKLSLRRISQRLTADDRAAIAREMEAVNEMATRFTKPRAHVTGRAAPNVLTFPGSGR